MNELPNEDLSPLTAMSMLAQLEPAELVDGFAHPLGSDKHRRSTRALQEFISQVKRYELQLSGRDLAEPFGVLAPNDRTLRRLPHQLVRSHWTIDLARNRLVPDIFDTSISCEEYALRRYDPGADGLVVKRQDVMRLIAQRAQDANPRHQEIRDVALQLGVTPAMKGKDRVSLISSWYRERGRTPPCRSSIYCALKDTPFIQPRPNRRRPREDPAG